MYDSDFGQIAYEMPRGEIYAPRHYEHALSRLGKAIAEHDTERHCDPCDNVGTRFENDVFLMQAYFWLCCTGEPEDHADPIPKCRACQPNFLHKRTGLMVNWYMYLGRDTTTNNPNLSASEIEEIVQECIDSLTD